MSDLGYYPEVCGQLQSNAAKGGGAAIIGNLLLH